MADSIYINERKYIAVKQASEIFGYSRDHITRLAKNKKVLAFQVTRRWFVSEASIENYFQEQKIEAQTRQAHLSSQRQLELSVRSALSATKPQSAWFVSNNNFFAVVVSAVFLFATFHVVSTLILESDVLAAVATVAPQPQSAAASLDDKANSLVELTPVFSDPNQTTLVENNRVIEKPEVTSAWQLLTP